MNRYSCALIFFLSLGIFFSTNMTYSYDISAWSGFFTLPGKSTSPVSNETVAGQIMPTLNLKIVSYGKTVEFMTTWPIKSNILTGRLSIYAVNGRKIVAFGILSGKSLQWDGKDALGRLVGPGVFIARLIIGSEDISKPFPIDL